MAEPPGHSLGGSSVPLSPGEVRRRRLAALGGSTNDAQKASIQQVGERTEIGGAAPALPTPTHNNTPKTAVTASSDSPKVSAPDASLPAVGESPDWIHSVPSQPFSNEAFQKLMWDDQITTPQDKERWILSGIDVHNEDCLLTGEIHARHANWGLAQYHGGPCGVLAAVQAEMLRMLLQNKGGQVHAVLARAMAVLLARSALTQPVVETTIPYDGNVYVVLPCHEAWRQEMVTPSSLSSTSILKSHTMPSDDHTVASAKRQKLDDVSLLQQIDRLADRIQPFIYHHLEAFRNPGGVMLLVMSLGATRPFLAKEFDDPDGTKLTAQFGHCGQELMNLMLTGQAVSNVFDNSLSPSGDMVCRGVQSRPAIGYLSQLEALRYCEVGGYYKAPLSPIWVVGSTSHFTVLFGDPEALKESKSDVLLDECRRAFKSVEGGEENGFIQSDQLGSVLAQLNIKLGGDEASRAQTLSASLEVSGAGIILWDDFWKAASRLMTGATLETVLQSSGAGSTNDPIIVQDLPMLEPVNETDEDMARRLNNEWGSPGMAILSAAAESVASMTDEDYARKLQAAYDTETVGSVAGSTSAVASPEDDLDKTSLAGMDIIEQEEDSKPAAQPKEAMEFEQYGDTFSLYHYNGLRGGVLTPFKITRLTAVEAVGASIALNRGSGSGGSQDLEDVVRTKWPSCSIDWLGQKPPYID